MKKIEIDGCPTDIYIATIEEGERGDRRMRETAATDRLVKSIFGPNALLCHHPDGAPFVENISKEISVAHSRHIALVSVSDIYVGADIEENRSQLPRVCRRILSAQEYKHYSLLPFGFLTAWTTKEALYKASRRLFDHEPDYAADLRILPRPTAAGKTFHAWSTILETGEMITVVLPAS